MAPLATQSSFIQYTHASQTSSESTWRRAWRVVDFFSSCSLEHDDERTYLFQLSSYSSPKTPSLLITGASSESLQRFSGLSQVTRAAAVLLQTFTASTKHLQHILPSRRCPLYAASGVRPNLILNRPKEISSAASQARNTWEGLHQITKAIEKCVPAPFNVPLQLFVALSDIIAKYIDTEEKLEELLKSLTENLMDLNDILKEGVKYGVEVAAIAEQAVLKLKEEVDNMQRFSEGHKPKFAVKIFNQSKIAGEVSAAVVRLNNALNSYHRRTTTAMAANLQTIMRVSVPSILPNAPNAQFDAFSSSSHSSASRGPCTPGTRSNLITKLISWAKDPSPSSSPMFWLRGLAGTGKSTVAYTVCDRFNKEDLLGASFFCSRHDPNLRSRSYIIPSIVTQLLSRHPAFLSAISAVNLKDLSLATDRHVEELLVQPWVRARASQTDPSHSLVVVVDALDEVEPDGHLFIEHLIRALHAQPLFRGLKFLITSRPHPNIVDKCASMNEEAVFSLEQISQQEDVGDVRAYLGEALTALRQFRKESIELITAKSGGLFIYAATVVRFVNPPDKWLTGAQQQRRLKQLLDSGPELCPCHSTELRKPIPSLSTLSTLQFFLKPFPTTIPKMRQHS